MSDLKPQAIYRARGTKTVELLFKAEAKKPYDNSVWIFKRFDNTTKELAFDCMAYGYLEPTEHFPFERWPWARKYLKTQKKGTQ